MTESAKLSVSFITGILKQPSWKKQQCEKIRKN